MQENHVNHDIVNQTKQQQRDAWDMLAQSFATYAADAPDLRMGEFHHADGSTDMFYTKKWKHVDCDAIDALADKAGSLLSDRSTTSDEAPRWALYRKFWRQNENWLSEYVYVDDRGQPYLPNAAYHLSQFCSAQRDAIAPTWRWSLKWYSIRDLQSIYSVDRVEAGRTTVTNHKNEHLASGRMRYREGKTKGSVQIREDLCSELGIETALTSAE